MAMEAIISMISRHYKIMKMKNNSKAIHSGKNNNKYKQK